MRLALVLLAAALLIAAPALAEKRLGLVIGNDAYSEVPRLDKAGSDARAVAARLERLGFAVIAATDADRREMNRRIAEFTARLQPGDTAFVFFAGHGVEIDGENYLLPADIAVPRTGEADFVKSESIALSRLLDRVRGTGVRTLVAVIDACRNNPFESGTGRSIGSTRGLGRIAAPQGTFVIFSAGAGQLALDELTEDDPAVNSVFTRSLLPLLERPGLELRPMMADLRIAVRDLARTVGHEQVPAYYDELLGEFYFVDPAAAERQAAPASGESIRDDFDLARSIGTAAALKAFLDRYADRSDDFTYQLASQMYRSQSGAAAVEPPPPATPPERQAALAPEPPPDTRAIVRDTQVALNAVGCNAGAPDGVIGRRTRAAFAAFLSASGSALAAGALGTEAGLQAVRSAKGTVCKPSVAAAPAPAVPDHATPAPAAPSIDMSGSWGYSATCAFNTKVTGTVTYSRTGPDSYSARLIDSLGRIGRGNIRVSGRTVSGSNAWPVGTESFTANLSSSGTSFSGRASSGCRFFVRR